LYQFSADCPRAEANSCAHEPYDGLRCINALGTEKIACDPDGIVFDGCLAEQAAYAAC
jgi:hypothetical protein